MVRPWAPSPDELKGLEGAVTTEVSQYADFQRGGAAHATVKPVNDRPRSCLRTLETSKNNCLPDAGFHRHDGIMT